MAVNTCKDGYSDSKSAHIPRLIGTVGATAYLPQIGYMIDPAHQGRGLATEALNAFLPVFFECLPDIDYCEAWVGGGNVKSLRVLEKCGFRPKRLNALITNEEDAEEPERDHPQRIELDEDVEKQLRLAVEGMNLKGGKQRRNPMVGYELRREMFMSKKLGRAGNINSDC